MRLFFLIPVIFFLYGTLRANRYDDLLTDQNKRHDTTNLHIGLDWPDSFRHMLEQYRLGEDPSDAIDSLSDVEEFMWLLERQVMVDRMLKENEIILLQKSNEIAALNLEKQEIMKRFLVLVLIIVFLFLIVLFFRFRSMIVAKNQLEKQKVDMEAANKMLVEMNTMRDKLFAIISHDLRNPFASIVSFSRIIKRDLDDLSRDEIRELVLELDRAVFSIDDLLENLLQWSRTQTGKLAIHLEYYQLEEILESNVRLYASVARDKQIELVNNIERGLQVFADIHLTDAIFRNLLSNAIKFTASGGRITIFTEVVEDSVHVCVEDSGVGMDAETQAKVLGAKTFFSSRGTADEKGSGLGLLICREFSERQGGKFWFTSEKGAGSRFYFSVPVRE